MKRVFKILCVFSVIISMYASIMPTEIKAAIFGVSATNNGNGTTTVTIYGACVGGFSVSAGGASVNVGKTTIDSNAVVTLSTGAGTFTVTATAISASDANYQLVEGSASTTVTVTNGSSGGGSTGGSGGSSSGGATGGATSGAATNQTNNEPVKQQVSLNLSELSVSVGTLDPAFSPDVTNYSVKLPRGTKKITVHAAVAGTGVGVTGSGDHSLKGGENSIDITLKEQDGDGTRTYTIKVFVEQDPTVFLSGLGEKKLGVLSLMNAPKLEGFEDYSFKISGKDVIGRKNSKNGLVVLYLSNSKEQNNYYIYDEKAKKITSIYIPISILGKNYAIITIPDNLKTMEGLTVSKVKIGESELDGWKFKNSEFKNYSLVYLMDENAKIGFYQYELTSNTIQPFSGAAAATQKEFDEIAENLQLYKIVAYSFIAISSIFIVSTGLLVIKFRKKVSK